MAGKGGGNPFGGKQANPFGKSATGGTAKASPNGAPPIQAGDFKGPPKGFTTKPNNSTRFKSNLSGKKGGKMPPDVGM
jgi:hypothetical protein